MADGDNKEFYADLDTVKNQGRGSCCTVWSFFLLFGTLLILGIGLIMILI